MDYWKGKVAVVTGASAGIGAEIIRDFAKAGINVVGLARRNERVEEIAKEMANAPGKIHAIKCDISNLDCIAKAFAEIEAKFKIVHILVNNAGMMRYGNFFDENLPFEKIQQTIDLNISGLAKCTREAYKLMQKHGDNCYIVNINSIVGHMTPNAALSCLNIYGPTKHAVTTLTTQIRQELNFAGNRRIKITSVSPGGVMTEFGEAAGIPQEFLQYYQNEPMLSGKDVSSTVMYLLSTPAHLNITELTCQATGEKM
ncbi:farnesol dehydrogenase-like [Culicoides brevitarsis]|uniref:farnesol dehydrogenase-like n=1 Tax=Culicoides brevitarsis TaxID=469753 RepID=UPI00307BDCB9